jgi:hypothetical protein
MTVQTALADLHQAVRELRDAADSLRVTVCEDAPEDGRTMHTDDMCEWALDLSGAAATMALEFQALDGAVADRAATEGIATAIGARHIDFDERYAERVAAPEHVLEMRRLALGPDREWRGWTTAVADAIGDCRRPLAALRRALYDCWRELAQHPEVRLEKATIAHLRVLDGETPAGYGAAEKQDV